MSKIIVVGGGAAGMMSAIIAARNGHEVIFTIGSDKALVDGKEETMYTKVDMFDNLPLLPYDLLVKYLGYEYNRTETEINIKTPFAK